MARKTAQQVAEKWRANFGKSAEAYKAGVMAVTTSPTELAAKAADRMAAAVQESVSSGRYQKACRDVTLNDWQQAAANKGAQRLTSGAEAGKRNMEEFMSEWLPVMEATSDRIKQMPKGTLEDSMARVRANMEAGKRYAGK